MNQVFYLNDPISSIKIEEWRYKVAYSTFEKNSDEELLNLLKTKFNNSDNYNINIIKKILDERGFNLDNLIFL